MCIDLHLHSHYSDGTLSPTALVEMAVEADICGIALTDHDTVEGIEEFLQAAAETGITAIPGIEISSSFRGYSLHMLGYGIDHRDSELQVSLERLQHGREKRNREIIARLQGIGLDIQIEELDVLSGFGQTGRPHIARLLTLKGIVTSMDDAFRLYLRKEAPAWAGRFIYTAEESIAMIHRAGGLAVLAHPGQITPRPYSMSLFIRELVRLGLDGVEVFYPGYSPKVRKGLKDIAARHKLVITGGSDYHGNNKPYATMAGKKNRFCPPRSLFDLLLKKIDAFQNRNL
ncbi:MAG: PHP domain-containing protein [Desulfobulbaceae bacterium]|nr:PHP domain-containing protein [Desulfobulbaceae bacterium]